MAYFGASAEPRRQFGRVIMEGMAHFAYRDPPVAHTGTHLLYEWRRAADEA